MMTTPRVMLITITGRPLCDSYFFTPMTDTMATDPTVDDAIGAIVEQIRTRPTEIRQYGYDVYLPRVLNLYAIDSKMVLAGDRYALDHVGPRVSPTFYTAAWELCRRGILRPSCLLLCSRARECSGDRFADKSADE